MRILLFLAAAMALIPLSMVSAASQKPIDQPAGFRSVGIDSLNQKGLNGKGVNIAVICRSYTYDQNTPLNDYLPDAIHNCLNKANLFLDDDIFDINRTSPHATAICSILFGNDPNAFDPAMGSFKYNGIIPEANAYIFEFQQFLINNIYTQLIKDIDIVTASVGTDRPAWWTNGFDALAEQYGLVIVAGIGNGTKAFDAPLYPAANANVIAVGLVDAVNSDNIETSLANFAIPHPQHSSFGPTCDFRTKPDIIAPGNFLVALSGEPNAYEISGNYTSFAAPVVSGIASLLIQKAKDDPNLSDAIADESGNCVIKAILLNSATKLPFWHKGTFDKDDDQYIPLDYLQGAGMVNAINAYDLLLSGQHKGTNVPNAGWDLNLLNEQANTKSYTMNIDNPNNKTLCTTLCWNKHYEKQYPFKLKQELDADLRLELWGINPQQDKTELLELSDSPIDNLEHIYFDLDPNYTEYKIAVTYNETFTPISNDFYALTWNIAEKQPADDIFLYDINTDGIVDHNDYLALFENWLDHLHQPMDYFIGDINNDGVFDDSDFELIAENYDRKTKWYKDSE